MDAQNAIQSGYIGGGETPLQSVVNFLHDGAEYAPCDLEEKTLHLAKSIESERWHDADSQIEYILETVRDICLTEKEEEWATWIGMAQKVIERRGTILQ